MPKRPPRGDTKRRLTVAQLEERLAVSKQTVWRWYKEGDFPKPHYLGQNRVWFESEVEAWEQKQMATLTTPPSVADQCAAYKRDRKRELWKRDHGRVLPNARDALGRIPPTERR